jgi:DNA helicase-2/ATP-dependent DNA helicase PcrA
MSGCLDWGDFAVLVRFSALSRALEHAFQKEGIPHRVLGGHKFFERQEVSVKKALNEECFLTA